MILLLSTSDTDLLSARSSGADYRLANPARTEVEDLPALLAGGHRPPRHITSGTLLGTRITI